MKKLILLIFLFTFSFFISAQNIDWNTLNHQFFQYYSQGNYEKAIFYGQQALSTAEKEFGKEHQNYATSLNNLIGTYEKMGNYAKAEKLYIEAISIRKKTLGENHPEYVEYLINLGDLYREMENYPKAEQFFLEALTIRKKNLGENHSDYAIILNRLANLYKRMGNYTNAESYYLQAIVIRKKTLGENHPDYFSSINSLAGLYKSMAYYEKAEPLYVETLAIRKNTLGENHPDYATSLNTLASLYVEMSNYPKAEPLYLESLAIRKRVLGEKHPNYASTLNNLATLYMEMGNFSEAESLYLEALAIRKEILGENHPDYAYSLNNLAGLYNKMGLYTKAERMFTDAMLIRKKVLGVNHADYANSLNNLAGLYDDMGNYSKAETLYIEALAIYKNVYGEDHPEYANAINNLATSYRYSGNYLKAEPLLIEAIAIYKKMPGTSRPGYAGALSNLAGLYMINGNYAQAEPLFIEAIDIYKKTVGENHPDYAQPVNNLAVLYFRTGRYLEMEILFLEALAIKKKVLGENHPDYATSLNNLAAYYSKLKYYAKAEPMILEALAIRKKVLGENHPGYAGSLISLASIYDHMGNPAKAEPFYLKALAIQKKALGINHPDCGATLNNLALLYDEMGNDIKAENLYKLGNDNLNRQIHQNFSFMSESEKELFVKTITYNFDIYNSFALRYKSQKPDFVAINYNNELAHKGMILQSSIALQQAITNSGDTALFAISNKLNKLKQKLGQLYKANEVKEKTDSIEKITNELEKELIQRGQKLPELQNLAILGKTSWQEVQNSLAPGEAAIEFVSFKYRNNKRWTDSIYYCALVLRKELQYPKMIYLCEERQLQASMSFDTGNSSSIDNFYNLQGPDNKEGYKDNSFYRLIWQPIDSVLEGIKKVYVAPSGLLHKISFNAIAMPDKKFLSDRYNLQTVSSTAVLTKKEMPFNFKTGIKTIIYGGIKYSIPVEDMIKQSNKYIQPTEQIVAAYRPSLPNSKTRGGAWGYLPGTLKEAQGINSLLIDAKLNSSLLSGPKANEENFKRLSGKGSPVIIHIATHGFFFPDQEKNYSDNEPQSTIFFQVSENPLQRSGLLFAGANNAWNNDTLPYNIEDGILTAQEISQMYLPDTKLVIMSACETGLGDIKGGEGVFGLQRAFKMAGVDYIIMSLWQVPDEQTSELMQVFYKKWLGGQTIREAFTAAQNQLKEKYRDSPFLWGAFVLIQ